MTDDINTRINDLLAQQDKVASKGYADIMNYAIETLHRLTIWTSGYTSHAQSIEKLGPLSDAKRRFEIMLDDTRKGQTEYYKDGLKNVGSGLANLADDFEGDPIASELYADGLKIHGMSLLGSTVNQIVSTVDAQKDKVNIKPLEIIATGLQAIEAGSEQSHSFYEANKSALN